MAKNLLITGLIFMIFTLQSCKSTNSKVTEIQISGETVQYLEAHSKQENEITKISGGKVEYKGVSFSYNPQIFGEVEAEEVAKQPLGGEDHKPNENFPNHLEFYFNKDSKEKGRIAVMPIEDYRRMYIVSNDLTDAFDENLNNLQRILVDKNFRVKGEIPFMPFYDATQVFNAKVKHVLFQDGKFLCFLTQYHQEINLINNHDIGYYCQGITNDKRNYIFAVFSVNVSFLPKDYYAEKFEGYKTPTKGFIETDEELKQYENYITKITKRLENLKPNEFEPNLKYFEEMISSLKIEK